MSIKRYYHFTNSIVQLPHAVDPNYFTYTHTIHSTTVLAQHIPPKAYLFLRTEVSSIVIDTTSLLLIRFFEILRHNRKLAAIQR